MTSYWNCIQLEKAIPKLDLEVVSLLRPIQNKGRLLLETGLTFSFTLPPIPPSVSDLKIEKVKAQLGLDLGVFFCIFSLQFLPITSNFYYS